MGSDLIKSNSSFRSTMEKLQAATGIKLVDLYEDGSKWMCKEYSTIGIVSFQLGLLSILRDYGIGSPDIFLGHSLDVYQDEPIDGFDHTMRTVSLAICL